MLSWRYLRYAAAVALLATPTVALSGVATVTISPVDGDGTKVGEAAFVFARTDDAATKFSVGQDETGQYVETAAVPDGVTEWQLTRVVAPGFLPVRVGLLSKSPSGETLQELAGMELSPTIQVPPIRIAAGGSVHIDLVVGDQKEVMAKFLEARNRALEQQKAEAESAAHEGPYETALRMYGAGDLDGALPYFRQALEQDPENAEIHTTLANVLYKAKRYDDFERAAVAALEVQPDNRELWMMLYSSRRTRSDMPGALDALLGVMKLGSPPADLRQHLTFVAQKMGHHAEAIPAWEALLRLDDSDVEACVALASLYAQSGDAQASDSYLERAVALAPDDAPTVYFNLASNLLAVNDVAPEQLGRAIDLLRKTIDLEQGYAPAYKKLGLALWKREDWSGTRTALQKYLELDPDAADKDQVQGYLESLPK